MRTADRLTRLPVLAAVYLGMRVSAVWGLTPAIFADTTGYLSVEFLTPRARLWPVPLVYSLVRSDPARVAVHVVAGTVAWVLLASVLASRSKFPGAVRTLVLLAGLAPQVIRYDLTILSESLAISVAVATVALGVRAALHRTVDALFLVSFVVFCMLRPQHLLFLFIAAAWILFRSAVRRTLPGLAGILLVGAALLGGIMLGGNRPTGELNLYTVIVERVLTDDARFAWFVDHGMPDVPGMREAQSYDYREQLPQDLVDYLGLPVGQAPPSLMRAGGMELARWVRADGWSTYARYVVSHPSDTRARLAGLADPTLDPRNDDFLPLASRTVAPRWLFIPWKVCAVTVAAGLLLALGAADRDRMLLLFSLAGGTSVLYVANALTSGIEHPRHMSTVAVLVRVSALVAVSGVLVRRTDDAAAAPTTV